ARVRRRCVSLWQHRSPFTLERTVPSRNEHGDALKTVLDLDRNGLGLQPAHRLKICELRNLRSVKKYLPAQPRRAEGRRLPVILEKPHIVFAEPDAQLDEAAQVPVLDVVW